MAQTEQRQRTLFERSAVVGQTAPGIPAMLLDANSEQHTRPQTVRDSDARDFQLARQVLIATCVVSSIVLVLVLVLYASDLLMLMFAGVLLSILLRRFSALVRGTGLGQGLSLTIVTLVLFGLVAVFFWLVADRIAVQGTELVDRLRTALESVRSRLSGYEWADKVFDGLPSLAELLLGRSGVLSRLPGFASTTLGVIANVAVVIVVGIYFASQPTLYSAGIKHLLPLRARPRAGEVLDTLDDALGRWLLGRFALMVINGGLTTIALWLLGVPLAPTLGLIAGVLNFIPNFGPFIAAVPAVLLAFVQSPQTALYTALIYLLVQMVDGYILTPLVDRKSVELPPVLTITAQLLLGLMFGFIGLIVASPLAAAVLILVKMLYVEDLLGDPIMGDRIDSSRQHLDAVHGSEV